MTSNKISNLVAGIYDHLTFKPICCEDNNGFSLHNNGRAKDIYYGLQNKAQWFNDIEIRKTQKQSEPLNFVTMLLEHRNKKP